MEQHGSHKMDCHEIWCWKIFRKIRRENSDFIKTYIYEQHNNLGECGPCPVLASYTLAFALQLRKKRGKTSVRVKKPDKNNGYFTWRRVRLWRYLAEFFLEREMFPILFPPPPEMYRLWSQYGTAGEPADDSVCKMETYFDTGGSSPPPPKYLQNVILEW